MNLLTASSTADLQEAFSDSLYNILLPMFLKFMIPAIIISFIYLFFKKLIRQKFEKKQRKELL